jgi:hypothetical protein
VPASVTVARTRLRDRDLEALAFIGRGYEVAQYQLHEAVFALRAPNVVSRFVTRVSRRSLIVTERLGGIGINRLRLTRRGRDLLVGCGVAEDDLFAPARPVALKDLTHTLAINDLVIALQALERSPDVVRPAWRLQRVADSLTAIPDVLAIWKRKGGRSLLLACEIDLGCERLTSVFLPKVERLGSVLSAETSGCEAGIVIFTRGRRRLELLQAYAATAPRRVMPFLLPHSTGSRDGIRDFRTLLDVD